MRRGKCQRCSGIKALYVPCMCNSAIAGSSKHLARFTNKCEYTVHCSPSRGPRAKKGTEK